MLIQDLIKFLESEEAKTDFLTCLRGEITQYVVDRENHKDTSNIIIDDVNAEHVISDKVIKKLLFLYLDKKLLEWDIEYIMNALDLIEGEVSSKASEIIFTLSSPEINSFIDEELVKNCIDYLEGKHEELEVRDNKKNFKEYQTIFK